MTKQQRKFKKRKQRERRIRQERHRNKFQAVEPRTMFDGIARSYPMTSMLETIVVMAVLYQRSVRRLE